MITKKITMCMNGEEFHSFDFPTHTEDKKEASRQVKKAIIKALEGGEVVKVFGNAGNEGNIADWSSFGFDGDTIKVEDINL